MQLYRHGYEEVFRENEISEKADGGGPEGARRQRISSY
jgi:hypothetical protein